MEWTGSFPGAKDSEKTKAGICVNHIYASPDFQILDKSLVHNLIGPLKLKDKEAEAKSRRNAHAPLPQCDTS